MDEGPVRNWAADVFDGRTDVSWIFRQRIRKSIRRAVGPPRPDIAFVTGAWDAIRFVEAGAPSGALSTLPNDVCRIRRAAVRILVAEAGLPGPFVAAAVSTANRIVATTLCQVVAGVANDVTPAPTELLTAIIEQPPGPMLAGEMSPAPKKAPSVRPTSMVAGRSSEGIAASPAYRASPDGSVVAVGVCADSDQDRPRSQVITPVSS